MGDQAKFLRMLKCIAALGNGRGLTIVQLADYLEVNQRTAYRYISTLQSCGFIIDRDVQYGHYFIFRPIDSAFQPVFSAEEVALIRQMAGVAKKSPVMDSILTKLFEQSELAPLPELVIRARLLTFIQDLKLAIDMQRQVVLQSYHSAHSNEVSDRLVEPIDLLEGYSLLLAYDPKEHKSKFFKLDRMAGVMVLNNSMKHRDDHQHVERDIFGMSGDSVHIVTLELDLMAYTLLREEFPRSIDYLQVNDGKYIFSGPVRAFEGVGRFVLGLAGHIKRIDNRPLLEYLNQAAAQSSHQFNQLLTEVVTKHK